MKKTSEFLATHVQAIPRSGIRDFFELVQKRGDVISLGIGEPDVSAPWAVREAAGAAGVEVAATKKARSV